MGYSGLLLLSVHGIHFSGRLPRMTRILFETGSSNGDGEVSATCATMGGGRGGPRPLRLALGLSSPICHGLLSYLHCGSLSWVLGSPLHLVTQLDAYYLKSPYWIHSSIFYLRSLQTSVSCP